MAVFCDQAGPSPKARGTYEWGREGALTSLALCSDREMQRQAACVSSLPPLLVTWASNLQCLKPGLSVLTGWYWDLIAINWVVPSLCFIYWKSFLIMHGPKMGKSKMMIRGPITGEMRVVSQGKESNSEWYQIWEFNCSLWRLSIISVTLANDILITPKWLT